MKSRGYKLLALLLVASAIVVAVVATSFILFERDSVTVLNANPYPCVVAVRYEAASNDWRTVGWMRLEPGERRSVSATFYRVSPQFYVAAESRDPGLLRWLSESADGIIYFNGDEGVAGGAPKDRDVNLEETGPVGVELEEVKFSRAKAGEEIYILTDPLFHDAVLRNEGAAIQTEDEGFELIREKASTLHESLRRQKLFEETFKSEKDFPFAFEFSMTDAPDERGFMYLGVTLTGVRSHTLHGDEIQLRDGDLLVGLGLGEGPVTPIFSPADAYTVLHEHGTNMENGGVTKPLHFLVARSNEVLEVESFFLFNPGFDWPDTEGEALVGGFLNSATLGFWATIKGAFSKDPKAAWKETQRLSRQKQFFASSARVGEVAGFFLPTPTKLLTLGKVARGGRLLRTTRAAVRGLGVELMKIAVYTYNTRMPAPHTKRLNAEELRRMFPDVIGVHLLSGVLRSGVEPAFKLKKRTFGRTR